jgi:hypothetical protein
MRVKPGSQGVRSPIVRVPGPQVLDYRKIVTGILFVLKTGIAWDDLTYCMAG